MINFRAIADELAAQLLADLKAGKLAKVGLDEVRTAVRALPREGLEHLSVRAFDDLEALTIRRVVVRVSK
jgi:hypothetical protein